MNRLLGSVAAAALMVALPAVSADAQTTTTTTTEQTNAAANLQQQDMDFVQKAAQGGMMEVALGQLAQDKAASDDVEDFGERMVEDHSRANDQLMQIAQAKGIQLPAEMSPEGAQAHQQLAGVEGAAFDQAYMQHMVTDHEKDVALFEQQARDGQDPELKAFAQATLPVLLDHLSMARSITTQVAENQTDQPDGQTTTDAAATNVAANADAQSAQGVGQVNPLGQMRADELIGKDVFTAENEEIGEIKDIVIDQNNKATFAVVSAGGFLGLGERDVAVPFDQVQMGAEDRLVLTGLDRQQLEALGVYEQDRYAALPRDRRIYEDQPLAATDLQTQQVAQDQTQQDVGPTNPLGQMRADELIGKNVFTEQNEEIGEIKDVVIDQNKATFAVISAGGFLGIGERDVAVQFDQLQMAEGDKLVLTGANRQQLEALGAYDQTAGYMGVPRDRPIFGDPVVDPQLTQDQQAVQEQQVAETDQQQPVQGSPLGQMRADELIGKQVRNEQNEDVGEIKDIVLDQSRATFVVVSAGGFLGVGERDVAVPFDALKLGEDDTILLTGVTRDQLKERDAFEQGRYVALPRDWRILGEQEGISTALTDMTEGTQPAAGTAEVQTEVARDVTTDQTGTTETTDPQTTQQAALTEPASQLGGMTAEQLIGKDVRNANGEEIGDIKDLVIDQNQNVLAVLSVGGFLGIGDRDVAVPFDRLQLGQDEVILMSNVTKEELEGMEPYKPEGFTALPRDRQIVQ